MRTYPAILDDGSIRHFEISNAFWWGWGPMRRLLRSIAGVADVRSHWFNENRFSFTFNQKRCLVHEAFGDSDRYWVGPADLGTPLDMRPIHDAFRHFQFRWTADAEFTEHVS